MKHELYYIIYKTTNIINGKYYIGKHHTSTDNDNYLGSGKILKRSINKNGKHNFIREILEYCTPDNVNKQEIFWIATLNATDKNIGYNITNGGEGTIGLSRFGEDNSNYGNKWTPEKRKKLSDLRKNLGLAKGINNPTYGKGHERLGEANSFFNKKHTDESKLLISNNAKEYWKNNKPTLLGVTGKNHPSSKYFYTFISDDGLVYDNIYSISEFCKLHNLNTGSVRSAFKCNRSTYKTWKIYRYNYEKI